MKPIANPRREPIDIASHVRLIMAKYPKIMARLHEAEKREQDIGG